MNLIRQNIVVVLLSLVALPASIGQTSAQPLQATDPVDASRAKDGGFTDQMLYQYLISEIAGQRGRSGLALRGMLDLAQRTRDPRLARRAVEIAFQARQTDAALEATTLWLEFEPESSVARQALTAITSNQGSLEATKLNLVRLLAQPKRTAGVLMQLSALLSRFPDKLAVAATVRELAIPHLKLPEAHFAIAQASMLAKDSEAALAAVNGAERQRPGWTQAAILKSQILRDTSDENAGGFLKEFLAAYPAAADVRVTYARFLASQKGYLQAREEFRIAMKSKPEDAEIPYAIGLLSQQVEDYADAESQFKRVIDLKPRDASPVFFNLGTIAEAKKQTAEAIDWYAKVRGGDYFVTAQLKIASILAKRDGMLSGRKFLQDAQAAQSDSPETRIQLILAEAQLLRDAKAFNEAFDALSAAILKNPDTADLFYDRAMVAEKIEKFDVLESDLRKVIELKPDHAQAYNALGYTLAERNKRLDEAYDLIKKALSLSPEDAYIQDSLGWVQFRIGRVDEALATLKKAYQTRRDPEIAAHLGEVLWAKGEQAEALKLWQTALLENPDNDLLKTVIGKFKP
ncbi:MAG: tetratricopeptide repeat protein [Burkholderiales bacterium]|nr:tetratricopeptide repeat protein [Burkholderiales bacterium]